MRDVRLDILRVLSITLVTSFHVWRFIGYPSVPIGPFDLTAPLQKGAMGVTMFIFISGVLCRKTLEQINARTFLLKRLLRIIPSYYFSLVVWNVLLTWGITQKSHNIWDNLTHLFFIHNLIPSTFYSISGLLWYLALQVQFYVLYAVWHKVIIQSPRIWMIASFSITLFVNVLSPADWYVLNRSVLSYGGVFILGVVFGTWEQQQLIHFRNWPNFILLIIGTAVISMLTQVIPWGRLDLILNGILLCLTCLAMPIELGSTVIAKIASRLALASFSIYLYNYILYCFQPVLKGWPGFITYSGIVFVFGVGAYWLIESPLTNWIRDTVRHASGEINR